MLSSPSANILYSVGTVHGGPHCFRGISVRDADAIGRDVVKQWEVQETEVVYGHAEMM